MPGRKRNKPSLPMVRLILATPLLEDLQAGSFDVQEAIGDFSLKPNDFKDPELWIPAAKMYAMVERFAEISHDPFFGVNSGEKLDPWSWPPMAQAVRHSNSVGEFLLRFMEGTQSDVNSCTYILKSSGDRTTFTESRVTDGGLIPRHNDGYTVTYLLALLRGAVGLLWDGSKVLAHVCDPTVIPPAYLGIRTAKTDTMGASISFPTKWLLVPIAGDSQHALEPADSGRANPIPDIVSAFHYSVGPHIHEFDLDAQRVAELCGLSKRTLARKMKRGGTTVSREISLMRKTRASQLLSETDRSIAEIAAGIGYPDPVVFSRAFKRWTGLSPRDYRKKAP